MIARSRTWRYATTTISSHAHLAVSSLTPRTYTILAVLNDIKDAFSTLLEKRNQHPALLLMYAFIDICAALANNDITRRNSAVFIAYLEMFASPGTQRTIPPVDLWAARSSLLHSFSPLGDYTSRGKAKPIFYYSVREDKAAVELSIKARGHAEYTLLGIDGVKAIAIWCYNGFLMKLENDDTFRDTVVANSEHLLLTQDALTVERFLHHVDDLQTRLHDSEGAVEDRPPVA